MSIGDSVVVHGKTLGTIVKVATKGKSLLVGFDGGKTTWVSTSAVRVVS